MFVVWCMKDGNVEIKDTLYSSYNEAFDVSLRYIAKDINNSYPTLLGMIPYVYMTFFLDECYSIDYSDDIKVLKTTRNVFGFYNTQEFARYSIKRVCNPITDLEELFAVMHV